MIMENTIENKQKFFAQYWGQSIGFHDKMNNWSVGDGVLRLDMIEYLELTPLSLITDEDAIEVGKLWGIPLNSNTQKIWIEAGGIEQVRNILVPQNSQCSVADFLRSKGYAFPFMGLSIREQVKYGWIKLTDNP